MALLSPGIEFYESSVTPASDTVSYTNGVATLGFATRGPENQLVRVESSSDFNYIFGKPSELDGPWSHILASSVLANNSVVYFMRLADSNALHSRCAVANHDVKGAQVFLGSLHPDSTETDPNNFYNKTYFIAKYDDDYTFEDRPIYLRITVKDQSDANAIFVPMTKATSWGTESNVFYCSMANVLTEGAKKMGTINPLYSFNRVGNNSQGYGIIVTATDELTTEFDSTNLTFQIGYYDTKGFDRLDDKTHDIPTSFKVTGDTKFKADKIYYYKDTDNTYKVLTGYNVGDNISSFTGTVYEVDQTVSHKIITTKSKFFHEGYKLGNELRTIPSIKGKSIKENYHFNISAKYSGSGMNNVKVVKSSVTSSVDSSNVTWSVKVVDESGVTLENYSGLTPDTFIKKIADLSQYISIDDVEVGTTSTTVNWLDGTYVLGKGQLLASGVYLTDPAFLTNAYLPVSGTDGVPMVGDVPDNSAIIDLYVAGLGNDAFRNCDENSFSILATPSCGETLVQNAAIEVCNKRGDAIYLIDVPREYCEEGKTGIASVVDWANSNSAFQNSQAAIYYGWFSQVNPYDTSSNAVCPASDYVAPKMIALDNAMGEFYAPAGVGNGSIIVADYIYSPDNEDRDKMVGNDNVVNPIIYSNTRGVMIFAQKTTDRTTSPLNRVGIRRMTNAIKRSLRSKLQALLFQPNNESSRSRARKMVADTLGALQSSGCIDTYSVNVVSGSGANRNDLNIYIDYVPYGLIEKIFVYVNISDADVTVTESV